MTQQEQFEADYLAADDGLFCEDDLEIASDGEYVDQFTCVAYAVWLQQTKRHEAEIAELVRALEEVCELQSNLYGNGMRTHIALSSFAEGARELLAKYEAKK